MAKPRFAPDAFDVEVPRSSGPVRRGRTSILVSYFVSAASLVFNSVYVMFTFRLPIAARNFKLLDELEDAQKGKTGSADISLGLVRDDDTYMNDWQATIFQAAVSSCVDSPCLRVGDRLFVCARSSSSLRLPRFLCAFRVSLSSLLRRLVLSFVSRRAEQAS